MELVCLSNVLFRVIYRLIWLQGNAFVLAIEPILCCRLVLNTRSTFQTHSTFTGLTTTGVAALEIELKAYRGNRSQAHKQHLDSMGLPQLTGAPAASLILNSLLWCGAKGHA